jgi:hypothetical protein
MRPNETTVAARIAVLFKRHGKTRARISDKTLRIISGRSTIRDAFLSKLRSELEELGICAIQIDRGGFALVSISALDGAPPITVKRYMPDIGDLSERQLLTELDPESDETCNSEEEEA